MKVLGEFGGMIETNAPEHWWNLGVDIDPEYDENQVEVYIGLYSSLNGDVVKGPQFHLVLIKEEDKVVRIEITDYDGYDSILGDCYIDENDMYHTYSGRVEKDPYGLRKRFSLFINEVVNEGPYLSEPKQIIKYNEL
jgi:hypothetical protein